ncbi:hypothetical protein DRH14_02785 [Candidatus Shapirobacteria bacterium]|nr:MAG: hypothetical protein DRH14_02785 [Candidatus Shapirobacteria bacterium]
MPVNKVDAMCPLIFGSTPGERPITNYVTVQLESRNVVNVRSGEEDCEITHLCIRCDLGGLVRAIASRSGSSSNYIVDWCNASSRSFPCRKTVKKDWGLELGKKGNKI